MLRTVRLNVLSRSAHVAAIHTPAKRVSLAPTGSFSKLPVGVAYPSTVLSPNLVNCYATSSGPEADTEHSKASPAAKAKKTSSKASTKTSDENKAKATKKATPRKKKPLTEKQQKALENKQYREKVKKLKEAGLKRPKYLPGSSYTVALQELIAQRSSNEDMRTVYKNAAGIIGSKSPEERQVWTPVFLCRFSGD